MTDGVGLTPILGGSHSNMLESIFELPPPLFHYTCELLR